MLRLPKVFRIIKRCLNYTQGQEKEGVREYFYFIDHQGMLFLDDSKMKNFTSCFKEKKFLVFFFRNLKFNNSRYKNEFPYLSLCGREHNFIRCDDYPIVFTHIVENDGKFKLCYNHTVDVLTVDFQPEKLYMCPQNGRVYHPAAEKVGGIGLVRSKLAIELSKDFVHDNGDDAPPTQFRWKDIVYSCDKDWYEKAKKGNT